MVELAQFGFRSAGELLTLNSPRPNTHKKFVHISPVNTWNYSSWNPLTLINKIQKNLPLVREDYLHPKFLQYASWLERISIDAHTATAKELLAILGRSGRIQMNQYQIWL